MRHGNHPLSVNEGHMNKNLTLKALKSLQTICFLTLVAAAGPATARTDGPIATKVEAGGSPRNTVTAGAAIGETASYDRGHFPTEVGSLERSHPSQSTSAITYTLPLKAST